MLLQRTIQKEVSVHGIGLHSGQPAQLTFKPAPENSGVLFIRKDLDGSPFIKPKPEFVQATNMATTLGHKDFYISTVEHCLAAVAALQIDNLFIELSGSEVPICDGSSIEFYKALKEAGLFEQKHLKTYFFITQPVQVGNDEKYAYITPYNGQRITCTIDFPHKIIGFQELDIEVNERNFFNSIAKARTFGFLKDAEKLRSQGLALGASFDNAVILDDESVINPGGLRFSDEFVRHKILDTIGDFVTLGAPLLGHVVLYKSGHDLMNQLIKKILSTPECYRLTTMSEV